MWPSRRYLQFRRLLKTWMVDDLPIKEEFMKMKEYATELEDRLAEAESVIREL